MDHSMKKLLAIAAVGAILAVPALARQYPNVRQNAGATHQTWSINNANPDFQLGGER
jgi:hypothetical protein